MITKNIKWLLALLILPMLAACSWEDLPAYEDADITGAQFYYRWASETDKDPITGEPKVKFQQLNTRSTIDAEAGTVSCVITVPGAQNEFTEAVRAQVSLEKLWAQVTLSTAARIAPVGDSKPLGTPENWTTPHKYVVTAADGTTKEWTITVTALNK